MSVPYIAVEPIIPLQKGLAFWGKVGIIHTRIGRGLLKSLNQHLALNWGQE
jgi:hypothetical protein